MSENLIGRMFVGPNGARYTFEGFEKAEGGSQDAIMRDLSGNRRRFRRTLLRQDKMIVDYSGLGWGFYLKPLVPAEATELTVSRDVDDPDLWVLTWWVGDDGFDAALLSSPANIGTSWMDALSIATRLTGRPRSDFEVVRPRYVNEPCWKREHQLGIRREEVTVYAA